MKPRRHPLVGSTALLLGESMTGDVVVLEQHGEPPLPEQQEALRLAAQAFLAELLNAGLRPVSVTLGPVSILAERRS